MASPKERTFVMCVEAMWLKKEIQKGAPREITEW